MALNVELPLTTNELFEENENDLQYSVDLCRENLKILVSPGSESSGVSSLDAEEAKVKYNKKLTNTHTHTHTLYQTIVGCMYCRTF